MRSKPRVIQPQTPLTAAPASPTPADERKAAIDTERGMKRRYGDKGRASTVLTGQGASNALG